MLSYLHYLHAKSTMAYIDLAAYRRHQAYVHMYVYMYAKPCHGSLCRTVFFVLKQQLHSTTCMCCHLCIQVKSIYIPSSKHSKANFIRIGHHFVCASSTSLLVVLCLSDQPVLPTADDDEPRRRRLPYQVASIPSAPQPHPKSGRPIPLIIEDSLEPILSFASWPSVTTPKSARHEMQDKLRPSNQSICSHRCLG